MDKRDLKPVYKSFPGWNTDIQHVESFHTMPTQMQDYINYINEYLAVPVKYISNGPGKEQIVIL